MRHVRMQLLFKKMLAMRPLRTWFRREILDVAVSIYFYQVLHFDLHLSSDDVLQHPLSQSHGVLQKEKPKSEDDQPVQSIHKTSAVQDDFGCRYKLDNQACAAAMMRPSFAPEPSPTSPLQPLTIGNMQSRKKLEEKIGSVSILKADINDTVELSIAVSEALTISELMKSGLPDDILPATAILEVAL